MKYALFLILPFFFLFLLISVPAHAVQLNYTDTIDGQVWADSPTTTHLGVGINSELFANRNRQSYMMFNISQIPNNSILNSAYLCAINYNQNNFVGKYIAVYNTSINWTGGNLTWNVKPLQDIIQDNKTFATFPLGSESCFNITNALQSSITQDMKNMSLLIRPDVYNASTGWGLSWYRYDTPNPPKIVMNITLPNNCSTVILGSYCDINDPSNRGLITTIDYTCLNDIYYTCPSGTLCTQILPQANITTPIVEDLVDCSRCWYQKINVGTFLNPIWQTRYTNCEAYPQCDNCNGAFCYGNTFQSNLSTTPVSLNQYAAGCVNSVGTVINIVLGNGTNTTVQNITDEIFPDANYTYNVTMPTCTNTSTTCYDINCIQINCAVIVSDNYADQIALVIGSTVGVQDLATARTMSSILMTMLGAAGVLVLFASMKIHGQILGQSFLISLLMFLVLFTLIGWFPSWLMVILMVISGLMIAKTLKVF